MLLPKLTAGSCQAHFSLRQCNIWPSKHRRLSSRRASLCLYLLQRPWDTGPCAEPEADNKTMKCIRMGNPKLARANYPAWIACSGLSKYSRSKDAEADWVTSVAKLLGPTQKCQPRPRVAVHQSSRSPTFLAGCRSAAS